MSLDALQIVPIPDAAFSVRGVVARVGRVALLYGAIAFIGATLTLFSFLLTWENRVVALAGLSVGLGAVHISRIAYELLLLIARHLRSQLVAGARAWSKLGTPERHRSRRRTRHVDERQEIHRARRLPQAHVFVSVMTALVLPALAVVAYASTVFRWSSMSGALVGVTLFFIERVILHRHGVGVGPASERRKVDAATHR